MDSVCREGSGPVASPVSGAYFEGQAVRTAVGVAVVAICLGLTGCSLFGKKQAAQKSNPKPFLGSEAPAKAETAAIPRNSSGPLPGANGVLAGRVIVEATDRPIRASILIKSLDRENAKGADLDTSTDESGYFTIPKLNAGENYELVVRATENGDLISRTLYAKPPNPTLLIRLDKRFTTASTPPPPNMPKLQDKPATAGAESSKDHKPAVSIDPPMKMEDQGLPSGAASGSRQPEAPPRGANPANIADGGFRRIMQPSETISIPPPPPPPSPSQPQWESMPDPRQPARSAPPTSGSVRMPNLPTPVPSCLLLGNRLDNLALYDLDGKIWEYRRDHRGRLTLLDFWYTGCSPCLSEIHHLVELQDYYGKYGLEVVSIACEQGGTVEEQRKNVRSIRSRYGVKYLTLLSGGQSCPVMGQFQVVRFPTLVLIDTDGTIIKRFDEGMDENARYLLRKLIHDRLVAQQSQP